MSGSLPSRRSSVSALQLVGVLAVALTVGLAAGAGVLAATGTEAGRLVPVAVVVVLLGVAGVLALLGAMSRESVRLWAEASGQR